MQGHRGQINPATFCWAFRSFQPTGEGPRRCGFHRHDRSGSPRIRQSTCPHCGDSARRWAGAVRSTLARSTKPVLPRPWKCQRSFLISKRWLGRIIDCRIISRYRTHPACGLLLGRHFRPATRQRCGGIALRSRLVRVPILWSVKLDLFPSFDDPTKFVSRDWHTAIIGFSLACLEHRSSSHLVQNQRHGIPYRGRSSFRVRL